MKIISTVTGYVCWAIAEKYATEDEPVFFKTKAGLVKHCGTHHAIGKYNDEGFSCDAAHAASIYGMWQQTKE